MSKLSVIVTVYNSEKYLRECLESIINQTYKDIEIICVNDGSTDNSPKILDEYSQRDSRIRVISQENKGVASARNTGLKNVCSEYITYVDDDDIIESSAYEKAMEYINDADLIHFGIKVFGDSNYAQRCNDDNYYKIKYKGVKKLDKKVILNSDVSVCNKIFKKSILEQNNITFPDGLNYEDAEFYYKYVSCSKTAYYLDEYFYHYRRSGDSIMSDTFEGTEKAIQHLYIMDNIFNFWGKNNYLDKNEKLFKKLFELCFNFAYWNSIIEQRSKVLYVASEYAEKFSKSLKIKTNFIKNLANKRYQEIYVPDLKFYQKIYKTKKIYDLIDRCYKEYTWILGIKLKKQHKDIDIIRRLNFIEDELVSIKSIIKNNNQ